MKEFLQRRAKSQLDKSIEKLKRVAGKDNRIVDDDFDFFRKRDISTIAMWRGITQVPLTSWANKCIDAIHQTTARRIKVLKERNVEVTKELLLSYYQDKELQKAYDSIFVTDNIIEHIIEEELEKNG